MPRWPLAGRLKDLLRALANVGDLPLPALPSTKRPRVDETEDRDQYGESAFPTLHMPPPSQPQPPSRYSTGPVGSGPQQPKHVLKRIVPSTPSEMSVFGPPLARRADGLYAFDPTSTGMTTSTATYASSAGSGEAQPRQSYYQSSHPSHIGYSSSGTYPSIPLDPGGTQPTASYAPSGSSGSYPTAPAGDYLSQDDYSNFLSAAGSNAGSMPAQSHNPDDSQFLSLLGPAMAQDAPVATMWSSLPATFQCVPAQLKLS